MPDKNFSAIMTDSTDIELKAIIEEPQDNDVMSMFASVWVKVEVSEDEDKLYDPTAARRKTAKKSKKANPKTLHCDKCDYKTVYKNCLQMHLLDHTNSKPYSCSSCEYSTKYQASLTRHLQIQHPTENETLPSFTCDQCDYKTLYKGNLSAHKRKHKSDKNYKCDVCSYATAYRHNYMKHSRVHNKVEVAYKCDKCPFVTKFEGHISRHLAKIHNEVSDKANKCDNCDFSTKVRWRLNIHKQRSRQQELIKCAYCEFESYYTCESKKHKAIHYYEIEASKVAHAIVATSSNFGTDSDQAPQTGHEKSNHYVVDQACELEWSNIQVQELPHKDRPFQCIMCEYSSRFKASVQRHYQRLHTDKNRPYKCTNCDFSTKTKDQISLHNKRSQSDVQLKCTSCSFTTFFKCQYIMHQKCHYTHKCTACDYVCRHKYEMQKHYIASHLGKGLQCRFCDFKSSRKESLLSHETTHTGNKPFKCKFCDYMSVRKAMLANHIRRNHSNLEIDSIQISDSKIQSLKIPLDENYFKTIDEDERQVLNELCSQSMGKVNELNMQGLDSRLEPPTAVFTDNRIQSLKVPLDESYFRTLDRNEMQAN